jgi:hypothetical protein
MKRLLPVALFILSIPAFAQNTPTPAQTLRLARATYEQGRLHEIPTQLNSDVIGKMDQKQDKVEAYKILCLTYIYLEEPEKADESMLNILRTDPYFQINEAVDPAEFVALYKTFRTTPIYRVGIVLGVNASQPNVMSTVNTDGSSGEYKYKIGLQFGISGELPITKKFTVHGDLLYLQKKFELTTERNQGDGDVNKNLATESQTWLSLPITVQYSFIKSKFNPYVALGVATDVKLGSKLVALRTREGTTSVEERNFDIKVQRNSMNFSAMVAAGGKYRMAGGYLIAEIKYLYGLTDVNNEETAYNNQDLSLSYGLPNAIFKVNSLSFSLSYVQNIFSPKKLRRSK